MESLQCSTQEQKSNFESEHGVRYSELFRLPYYDPIRMHVIDPMHNLLLGVAKHAFMIWVDTGLLNDQKLKRIDERQLAVKVPSDIGRISGPMSKVYKCLKADEWKHWVLIYSMYCLRNVLNKKHLNVWCMFVNACSILCKQYITIEEAESAHQLLKIYADQFSKLYGNSSCVPNMHLMHHLRDCIQDYGSVYSFWCFSFERFNGILGKFKTNNHSISIQIMRRFVSSTQLLQNVPECLLKFSKSESEINAFSSIYELVKIRNSTNVNPDLLQLTTEKPLSVLHQFALHSDDLFHLTSLFNKVYKNDVVKRVALMAKKAKRVSIGNEVFATKSYRGGNTSYCNGIARWPGNNDDIILRPMIIESLFLVQVIVIKDGEEMRYFHWVAECLWLKNHEYVNFFGINCPTKLWSTEFENYSEQSFIPLKYIHSRYVSCKELVDFTQPNSKLRLSDVVNIIIPIPTKSILT